MARFAEGTAVTPENSRAEIERTLRKYGADAFVSGFDERSAVIRFRCHGKFVQFSITVPGPDDPKFRMDGRKSVRTPAQRKSAQEAEERRLWRALGLAIKAKLEVVQSEIATFEEEFAANIVLPTGETVGQWLMPQIEHAYETGEMPRSLLALPAST